MQAAPRLFVVAMLLYVAACSDAISQEQPNIIVILADELGYSDLGCFGGEIDMPNIDAFAAGGVNLTQVRNYLKHVDAKMPTLDPKHASHADSKDGDADADGLPDKWEFQQLLTHAFGPEDDPDRDGITNSANSKQAAIHCQTTES